jgi:protein-tyrosine phosphatase
MRFLLICTANECRSPVGAALLAESLAARDVEVDIGSAGLLEDGRAPSTALVRAMRDRGLDLSKHSSRRLRSEDVGRSDLILTMEHHHVGEVIVLDPAAWPRTFTLKEIVRRSAQIGKRRADEPFDRWRTRLGAGRTRLDVVGAWHDDIADPRGGSNYELERTVDELEGLIERFVDAGWPVESGG